MIYLDCNATTPVEPSVQKALMRFVADEFGNAGSRTHEFGARAKRAVQSARARVAEVIAASPSEVVFTSGATESNNLALLGLADFAESSGRTHIVSTEIEHKAVLEPLSELEKRGFTVTRIRPQPGGWVDAEEVAQAVRPDTLVVSVMHVNNETGVIQPISEIAERMRDEEAFLHVDAAQGFGKLVPDLENQRIDLMSISAHKVYGPKGVGALVLRRRGFESPPISPLCFGGGQEKGLRPGTLPVHLIAGFGEAAELALANANTRNSANERFRREMLDALASLDVRINGNLERTISNTLNLSVAGVDAEAAIVALKEIVAVSNGSACTSQRYEPSHVLTSMGLSDERVQGALRFSWCHLTERPEWDVVVERLQRFT